MGRKGIDVVVSELEREQLLSMSRSRSLPRSLVRRAKIVLMAADGHTNQEIAFGLGGAGERHELDAGLLLDECFEFGASEHFQMQQRPGRLSRQQFRVWVTQIVAELADHVTGLDRIWLFQHNDCFQRLRVDDRIQFLHEDIPVRRVRRYRLADDRRRWCASVDGLDLRPTGLRLRLLVGIRDGQFRPLRQDADDLSVRQITDAKARDCRWEWCRVFLVFFRLGSLLEIALNETPLAHRD